MKDRLKLILLLALMPDEAFSWVVLALTGRKGPGASPQVFPDGIGGFSTESKTSILATQKEARSVLGVK